jgi:hypothetical protein
MTLDGGRSGPVPFPHQRHQKSLADCNACHELYPQRSGVLDEFKRQGQLGKKQVMNQQCIACHKQKKRAGEKSGPTTCKSCHAE